MGSSSTLWPRLTMLAREAEKIARDREAQSERLRDQAMRMKRTERMADGARRQHREAVGKHGFKLYLETLTDPDDASLP